MAFQKGLVERMELKPRVEACMTQKCDPHKQRAEAIAERIGLDEETQKKLPTAQDFISDPETFIEKKTWTMRDVVEFHRFGDCFEECQKPVRMF